MTLPKTAALFLPLALVAGSAIGAASAQTRMVEIDNDQTMVPGMNVTVDQLDDLDVYDASNNKIGEVEEVLGADRTTPSAVSVDFDRSLDPADRDRVVELSQFQKTGDILKLPIDAAAVAQLPTYDD